MPAASPGLRSRWSLQPRPPAGIVEEVVYIVLPGGIIVEGSQLLAQAQQNPEAYEYLRDGVMVVGSGIVLWKLYKKLRGARKAVLNSFEDIIKHPVSLYGKSADEDAAILGPGWVKGSYGVTGTGWKFTKGDKIVFYHEGGRHVGRYYGYSSGTTGKVKIVGECYKPLPGDKAKIIEVPKE